MKLQNNRAAIRGLAVLAVALFLAALAAPSLARRASYGGGRTFQRHHQFRSHGHRPHTRPRNPDAPSERSLGQMEDLLRANTDRVRLSLLRTYLPFRGRRAVPLPSIEQVFDGVPQGELPLCPVTSVVDDQFVNFSRVLQLLIQGNGDEIDFLVEMARALEIPIGSDSEFPYCAWWGFVDERFFNWIFPDAVATYWFTPFIAPPEEPVTADEEWHIIGRFIRERYKSFALYDGAFNPFEYEVMGLPPTVPNIIDSTVTDFQMKPFGVGQNPFQVPDLPLLQYGQFKIVMKVDPSAADVQSPDSNVVPFYGNIVNKYVREGGGIPLPLPCNRDSPDNTVTCPNPDMFQVPSANLEQGVVSNVNNAYVVSITKSLTVPLSEPLQQKPAALVMRGRVPVTSGSRQPPDNEACDTNILTSEDACYCQRNPSGCLPIPWERETLLLDPNGPPKYIGPLRGVGNDDINMRYWSVCTAVYALPYPTIGNERLRNRFRENTGCVPDTDIIQTDDMGVPDPDGGWFTIVVSSEAAKPRVFKVDDFGGSRNTRVGANWIEGIEGVKMLINLRNMYPTFPDFVFGMGRVGADSNWVTAFRTMQDFYPVINAICPVERIDEFGWGACVAPAFPNTCGRPSCPNVNETGIGPAGIVSPSQAPEGMRQ